MTENQILRAALDEWRKSENGNNATAHPYPVDNAFLDGYRAALAAPSAEQAKQVGWIDGYGNVFPLGAWKPDARTYHDAHKTNWQPVYTTTRNHSQPSPQQRDESKDAG